MVSATVNSVTTSFVYRGDGLRESRAVSGGATTQFTWDIASGLPVVLDDGNQYIYGAGLTAMKQSGSWYYYLADGLGSTMAVVDSSGNSQKSYAYDVYGEATPSGGLASEFDFAGQQTDGTGLQYLRARYYDPETGTFLSREPLAKAPSWLGNPTAYAAGNPARLSDPSGTRPCDTDECGPGVPMVWSSPPFCGPDFPDCNYPTDYPTGSVLPPIPPEPPTTVGARDFTLRLIGEYLYVVLDAGGDLLAVGGGPVKKVQAERTLEVEHPESYADDLFRSLTKGMDPKPYKGGGNAYPGKQVQLKDGSIVGIRRAADGTLKVDVNSGSGYVKFTIKGK